MNLAETFAPKPLPRRDYLVSNIIVNGLISVMVVALVGALAISRASHHRLTGVALAFLLAGGAALSAALTSVTGMHTGILDTTRGLVLDAEASSLPADTADAALQASRMWRRAALGAGATLVWAGGLGLLLDAVINGRVVGYVVLFVALLVSNTLGGAAAGALATARGITTAATGRAATPRPMRARAWREIAPLLAGVAFLGAAGFAVLLFHDYRTGVTGGQHALTRTHLLEDLPLTLIINAALMMFIAGRAGRAEAALGLVDFDDAALQRPPAKSEFSRNAVGWAIFLVVGVMSVVQSLIPHTPSLAVAAFTRAVYSAAIAYVGAGFGYVRGAANTLAAVEASLAGVPT
jgi:hypothetical protein